MDKRRGGRGRARARDNESEEERESEQNEKIETISYSVRHTEAHSLYSPGNYPGHLLCLSPHCFRLSLFLRLSLRLCLSFSAALVWSFLFCQLSSFLAASPCIVSVLPLLSVSACLMWKELADWCVWKCVCVCVCSHQRPASHTLDATSSSDL